MGERIRARDHVRRRGARRLFRVWPWCTALGLVGSSSVALAADEPAKVEEAPQTATEPAPPDDWIALPPQAPTRKQWPDQLGPFAIEWDEGSSALEVGFAGQLQTEVTSTDATPSEPERDLEATVFLRRIRLLLRGRFFDERLTTRLQLSTAPNSLELMDYWVEYRFLPDLRLRLGQYKIPYTRHREQSFSRLVLVDWSTATRRFGAERQLGLMLHNGLSEGWSYGLGVFTGVNARSAFETALSTSYAEPLPNPSDLRDPAPPAEVHPEAVLRVAHSAEGIAAETNTDAAGGPLRHHASLSATWDAQPTDAQDFVLRVAPELLLKAYHVSLNVVGHGGFFAATSNDLPLGALGVTGEAAWRLHRHVEVSARYGRVDYLEALRDDALHRANARIAAAAPADRPALVAAYSTVGTLQHEQEGAIGLNVYFVGHSVKWQHDFAWLHRATDRASFNDQRLRMQVQVAF